MATLGLRTNSSPEGTTYANSNTIAGSTPAPQVYRSERYGQGKTSFSYNIPVSNGSYNVNLDFAESYVTGLDNASSNVSINGTQGPQQLRYLCRRGA